MIPVVVTSVVLQFMPDIIPMHHDLEGNTDRWGSKTESFIFPVIILFITLFWHLLIYVFEKKSKNANTEKEQMEAKSSAKVLCVVGISQAIMFGIMHYFILYSSWIQANAGGEHAVIDIAKVSCILCGIIFIVLGNFMTKAKRNAVVGVRTVWSMHNDNTWRKSNRFGAICIIITGLLTIITTVFTSGMTGTIFMLIYLLLATIVTVVYSKKIYDKEIKSILLISASYILQNLYPHYQTALYLSMLIIFSAAASISIIGAVSSVCMISTSSSCSSQSSKLALTASSLSAIATCFDGNRCE